MTKSIALRDFALVISLVLIWGFFTIASGHFAFVSARNLSNLAVEVSITAVLALGMLLIILPGHIDLSVGSGAGLFGGVAAVLIFKHHWPAPAAMGVATVAAVALWFIMGSLIVTQRIPAFIITLAGLLIFRGMHWLVIQNATIPVTVPGAENILSKLTTSYLSWHAGAFLGAAVILALAAAQVISRRRRAQFGFELEPADMAVAKVLIAAQLVILFVLVTNAHRGIPVSAVILAVAALAVYIVTQHSRFGRYLYAIGGNEEAAVISGIPVNRVVIGAFAVMGLIVAITGFLQTAYPGNSTTTVGELLELDAIAACVIGGTSLKGGRGTVSGVLVGALIMASMINGMTLMAVSPEIKYIARGAVLALAVWMDVRLGGAE